MKLHSFDQETSILIPGSIKMMKETELTQYYIKEWQLTYYDKGEVYINQIRRSTMENFCLGILNEGIKMEISFQRRLTNELLTTFVPSFFLLGISFATTYFKAFYFEANVTVNLTVMLVATTLFIRYLCSILTVIMIIIRKG